LIKDTLMTKYVALLRAVNVGGTGRLPMADLRRLCSEAGYTSVQTYIASGNVIFDSNAKPATVKKLLEARLADYAGKPVGVQVRTSVEIAQVLADNPFTSTATKHTYALFLDAQPTAELIERATGRGEEEISLGKREIYIAYPNGMGDSTLKLSAADAGTARNMNTIAKLVEMTRPA
jgi:uncharacterized protein (DUF1697 family)